MVTIPKRFGDKYLTHQQPVTWRVESADSLSLLHKRVNIEDDYIVMVMLNEGQYKVTLPKGLASAMRVDSTSFEWDDPTDTSLDVDILR